MLHREQTHHTQLARLLDRVMGVHGLSARLKEVASKRVSLDACEGEAQGRQLIVDGHYALHLAGGIPDVAVPLVLDDNVVPLAMSVANRLNKLATAGWVITVVFDGRTPPGKANTACGRAATREEARARCFELDTDNVSRGSSELRRAATRAVHFSSSIVARVSRIIVHLLGCTCIRAPYESDGQLAVLEDMHLQAGREVLVHGTDSDLIVLGVRSLLWDFTDEEGSLFGQVFTQRAITRPQLHALKGDGDGSKLLRLLHGISGGREGDEVWWSNDAPLVMDRLRLWSSVAGNDYSKFEGIGPQKATAICLVRSVGVLHTLDELAGEISRFGGFSLPEVRAALKRSETMTLHPVVYCVETGQQRHLSDCESTDEVTKETGTLAAAPIAGAIARGVVCPCTLEPWAGDLLHESLDSLPALRRVAIRPRKRRAPPSRDTNNFERTGFSCLPTPAQLAVMNVAQLREFALPLRCFEHAGISSMRKPELLQVLKDFVKVIEQSGLVGSSTAFRTPQQYAPQSGLLQPDDGWLGWEPLRTHLPEFAGDAIIIAWLRQSGSLAGDTGRVLYRGMQRVLDFGALGALEGIPPGEGGGILHLRFKALGSYRDVEYLVQADVRVESVHVSGAPDTGGLDDVSSGGGDSEEATRRLVATAVVAAWCECTSGAGGGCHHVCMALHLVRLLQLTEHELEAWDPESPTSVACQWILEHCGGRRGSEFDMFKNATVTEIAAKLRQLRDPKRVPLGGGIGEEAKTRGVVAMDRRSEFSSHPAHGVWAGKRQHFDEGETLSPAQWDALSTFVDGERVTDKSGDNRMAVDVLQPRLRPHSP